MSDLYEVKPHLSERAHLKSREEYDELYQRSIQDPEGFWREQADILDWYHAPESIVREDFSEVEFSFYDGGKLNASYNCVDRHAATQPDKTAIIWAADEPGEYRHISYRELGSFGRPHGQRPRESARCRGAATGSAIYLPMIPELAMTMLACARIGAVHSVVFGRLFGRVPAPTASSTPTCRCW